MLFTQASDRLKPEWYDDAKEKSVKIFAGMLLLGVLRLFVFGPSGPYIDCGTLMHPSMHPLPF